MDKDQLQEPNSICSSVLHEDAIVIKDSDKDATEDRDTPTSVLSKQLVESKSKQKPYPELPPAYVLPYLVLIENCLHLPFPIIRKQCLTGEILCRIDSLMLRRKKKKPPTLLETAKVPIFQETKYVTFEGLKDLQWKLFKGLLKRKPKTIGIWREADYRKKSVTSVNREAKEYILPLLPKDWIIDESLKFPKEKIFLCFLETESHL
ncbi:uncharacterized protein LOC120308204 [Crotalus tigris]|uniref:uncharacterized protein LOC120308204 n=1 Tax=Crotalus tigris TaxID=88082 RepID=UPI00192F62A8|nr:uncharacterized protein LOC120308204 [Crotalus tigris]